MTRAISFILTLGLLSAGAHSPATGAPQGNLGLFGGFHLTDASLDIYGDRSRDVRLGSGACGGLRAGYLFGKYVGLEATVGGCPLKTKTTGESAIILPAHLDLIVYLSAGAVAPYLSVGGGFYQLLAGDFGKDIDVLVTGSAGLRLSIKRAVAFRFDARVLASDAIDKTLSTSFLFSGGFDVLFGGRGTPDPFKDDADRDGVKDTVDACPKAKGPPATRGCPDRDGDGVVDTKDLCPKRPGVRKFQGCPDTDSDGIPDTRDRCPTQPGTRAFHGCRDIDSDGIPDDVDGCPKVPGGRAGHGCPRR